jgi:DNA-binding MarR family transcriptional regulator
MGEIADRLRLATHAVSPIVDRLADAGLVNRIRDSSDGRVVHVRLTRSGSDLQAAAARIQDQVRVRTFLDDDEIVRVRDQLIAMVDRMGASDAGA